MGGGNSKGKIKFVDAVSGKWGFIVEEGKDVETDKGSARARS
jgi:hypothetical protein